MKQQLGITLATLATFTMAIGVSVAPASADVGRDLVSIPIDPASGVELDLGDAGTLVVGLPSALTADDLVYRAGIPSYNNNDGSRTTPVIPNDGGMQLITTIENTSAPTSYSYPVTINDKPAVLRPGDDGSVVILDDVGTPVNLINAPWAVDASGVAVPTHYSIEGNVLTQHVDHHGAVYPVLADPRLTCDALFCTVVLNKGETQTIASHGGTAAAILGGACALLGTVIAGIACAVGASWAQGTASDALAQGQCLGIRRLHVIHAATFPVVTSC